MSRDDKMKNPLLALACLSWALVGTSEAWQMGTGRVTGTVTDTDGNPIAGAQIVATTEGAGFEIKATSDENGEWAAMGFRGGAWTFTVTAKGYVTMADTLSIRELAKNPPIEIVLEKIAKGRASGEGTRKLLSEANEAYLQKNYDEALAKYQELLEESPTLYQVHLNIGDIHRARGDLDEAMAEYQMVLEEDPSDGQALASVGDVLIKQGKLDEAVEYFEKAVELNTDDETLPYNVAELYFNTGNVEKAIGFYQKAVEIKPDWLGPYLKIGYAYLNLGKIDEAAEQFHKIVEVAPDSQEAQLAQAALNSLGK
jgi:tetratricopeptide (TPR) repeat protein